MPVDSHRGPLVVERKEVIHVVALVGDGQPDNPERVVDFYYEPTGELLASRDDNRPERGKRHGESLAGATADKPPRFISLAERFNYHQIKSLPTVWIVGIGDVSGCPTDVVVTLASDAVEWCGQVRMTREEVFVAASKFMSVIRVDDLGDHCGRDLDQACFDAAVLKGVRPNSQGIVNDIKATPRRGKK